MNGRAKRLQPDEWGVINGKREPKVLHLEGGPQRKSRGPLREPVGDEWNLRKCKSCLQSQRSKP
jgi:hypothetical protein